MTAATDRTVDDELRQPTPSERVRRLLGSGFVRFVLVGGVSAAIDTGLLWLLHGVLGVWLPVATFAGVSTAFVVNFLLNRWWVFGSASPAGGQLVRYLMLAAVNWGLTVLGVSTLAAAGTNYLVARLSVLAVLTVLNFIGYRTWVFRDRDPR